MESSSWEVELAFRIHSRQNPGADGFAFWYTESKFLPNSHPGRDGQDHLWGNTAAFKGLGVIFDTYDNDGNRDNPSVHAVQNDGSSKLWSIDTDLQADSMFKCTYEFRNTYTNEKMIARIAYAHDVKSLQVYLRTGTDSDEQFCGKATVDLPTGYYFGLTATTGHLADNHDIHHFFATSQDKADHS